MSKPNVLLVIADQWRAQSCGYAGCADVQTPHLDKFASESCNLSHAISSCPVCTPTRASLLTGLYPDRHGLFLNDAPLNPDLPGFGKFFKKLGYDTAWVGKWHIDGHHRYGHIPQERRHGFDYWKTLECTHAYWNSRYYDQESEEISIWDGYDAEAQTNDVIDWIKGRKNDTPFCAALSWGPPHSPYETAPEEYKKLYDPAKIALPENVAADKEQRARECLAGYYAHCTALDVYFGRLMDVLDERGLTKNTIVIFTSDHGDYVGAHGMFDKQGPWDESIRIPCLIRGPQIPAGENKSVFNLTDFWPTIAGLVQQPLEADIQGRDWSTYIRSQQTPEYNYSLYGSYHVFGNWPRQAQGLDELYQPREARGIRNQRYTYVEDRKGPWLLYDNKEDPQQLDNRVNRPEMESVQNLLSTALHSELDRLDDEFLAGGTYVKRWGYTVDERGTIGCPGWEG